MKPKMKHAQGSYRFQLRQLQILEKMEYQQKIASIQNLIIENASKFGDPSYTKKHGSAGCIRLPDAAAIFIYENVSVKTPVLVKK